MRRLTIVDVAILIALAVLIVPKIQPAFGLEPTQYRIVQPTMIVADKESPRNTLSRVLTEETQKGWTFVTLIQLPGPWIGEVSLPVLFIFRKP
jgi:hypothetical protein